MTATPTGRRCSGVRCASRSWPRLASGDGTWRPEIDHAADRTVAKARTAAWWALVAAGMMARRATQGQLFGPVPPPPLTCASGTDWLVCLKDGPCAGCVAFAAMLQAQGEDQS